MQSGIVDFLTKSYSPYHVIKNCVELLETKGFKRLNENDKWTDVLKPLQKYFYTRNGSSIVAFIVGGKYEYGNGITMSAGHSDCPTLKIKLSPIYKQENIVTIGTELYGGGNWHTWFDRDLGLAGRVIIKNSGSIESKLICIDQPILHIPSVAIHYDREMNKSFSFDKEIHLRPLFDIVNNDINESFIDFLAKYLSIEKQNILDFELSTFDINKPCLGGVSNKFLFSQGLDNRSMSYITLNGFIESLNDGCNNEPNIRLWSLLDNEEVGSETYAGALGTLINDFFTRLFKSEDVPMIKSKSFFISADAGHGIHPNYPEYNEKNNSSSLGKGCAIKTNGNMRYSTNSINRSILKLIASNHNVPIQDFILKQTLVGGTTIGPLVSSNCGIETIDIGIPLLAMHSIRETACIDDINSACDLMKYFYQDYPHIKYDKF